MNVNFEKESDFGYENTFITVKLNYFRLRKYLNKNI